MAGDWIKMRMDLCEDPAVVLIAETLNKTEDEIVGKLHRLWSWADKHTREGKASSISQRWVDKYVSCPGFAEAMAQAGWVAFTPSGIEFPDFGKHNGKSAKTRAEGMLRQRTSRKSRDEEIPEAAAPVTEVSQENCDKVVTDPLPEKRREDRDREIESGRECGRLPKAAADVIAHAKTLMPPADPAFAEAWWNEMESSGWIDRHQRPVGKWKHAFQAAWAGATHRQHEQQARRNTPAIAPAPKKLRSAFDAYEQ